jgi:hypothetical protein
MYIVVYFPTPNGNVGRVQANKYKPVASLFFFFAKSKSKKPTAKKEVGKKIGYQNQRQRNQ